MSAPSPVLERALASLKQRWPWFIVGGALLGLLLMLGVRTPPPAAEGPSEQEPVAREGAARPARADGGASGVAPIQPPPEPEAKASVVDAGPPLSPNVKLTFRTYPPRRATVTWGSKRLGVIERGRALVVERARDSGPLDVVVRSPGYLPVHARAYTFNDSTVDVRITPVDKKDTLYGYQQPLGDAGAPVPPVVPPASPVSPPAPPVPPPASSPPTLVPLVPSAR